jgi:predicted transcriptional regulator of viral defense system
MVSRVINLLSVIGRLYELAAPQGGYFTARQAGDAGVSRQTLSYHATSGSSLERVGPAVYRLRRFPEPSHGHVFAGWLPLAHADAVVSHESALELLDLADVIAEQVDLAVQQSVRRGLTTPRKLRAALPATWRSRLDSALERDAT